MKQIKTSNIIRLVIIGILWLVIAAMVLMSQPFNLFVLIMVAFSGIIVFVPLYKKYFRQNDGK